MTDHTRGILLGVGASLFWGSTYVAIRLIYRASDLDPLGTTFARFSIGGLALAGALMARGRGRELAVFFRDPLPFFWLGLTGIALMGFLGAVATELTAAVNVSLVMNSNPIFVVLLSPLIGERLTSRRLSGVLLGLAGIALVAVGCEAEGPSFAGSRDLPGILLAAGAALTWAAYTLLGKGVVQRYGGLLTTTAAMLWGALLLLPFLGAAAWPRSLSWPATLYVLYLGVIPTAVAFALWYRALALVDAAALAPTQYLAPIATAVLAWLLLDEQIGLCFMAGLVLVFGGIALTSRPEHPREGITG
ncbi:MAG TPA: DMT family transporter [Armatimonadetes bacterium]|nr:DMT family transporter [Armatimonadota bacterium]